MLTVIEALEKAKALATSEETMSNPFVSVEAIGYVKAVRDIYLDELSDSGSLYYVNRIISNLLLLTTKTMIEEIEKEGEKSE